MNTAASFVPLQGGGDSRRLARREGVSFPCRTVATKNNTPTWAAASAASLASPLKGKETRFSVPAAVLALLLATPGDAVVGGGFSRLTRFAATGKPE